MFKFRYVVFEIHRLCYKDLFDISTAEAPTTMAPKSAVMEDELMFPDPIPRNPQFVADFDQMNKVERGGSITMSCTLVSVMRLMVMCNNARLSNDDLEVEEKTDRETGGIKSFSTLLNLSWLKF